MTREELRTASETALHLASGSVKVGDCADIFFWFDAGVLRTAIVPWKNRTERDVPIQRDGDAYVNGAPLPNGIEAGRAYLAGVRALDVTHLWNYETASWYQR